MSNDEKLKEAQRCVEYIVDYLDRNESPRGANDLIKSVDILKQQARAEVIEEIVNFISDGEWTCNGSAYYQLKYFLTKLSEGNK